MTVALVRERKDSEAVEVAFSESARFYRPLRANSQFERIRKELCQVKANKLSVRVLIASGDASLVEDVKDRARRSGDRCGLVELLQL